MRKEYLPALLLYGASFIFFVAAIVGYIFSNIHASTWLVLGFALLLFASSRLVKIGKKLREDEEKEGEDQ